MSFFEKKAIGISVRVKGIPNICYLDLPVTYDEKNYENFILLKKSLGRSGSEEIMRCDLTNLEAITYKRPLFGSLRTLSIVTKDNNEV